MNYSTHNMAFIIILAALFALGTLGVATAQQPPGNVGTVWTDFPTSSQGYFNLDFFLTPRWNPGPQSYYFWANQFSFEGGDGGYMGLQSNGGVFSHGPEDKKITIISIWDAVGAVAGTGSHCMSFGHEGSGWTCRREYDWVADHEYRMRLWVGLEETFNGQQVTSWYYFIKDMTTGVEYYIGTIYLPRSWGWLTHHPLVWSEYYLSEANGSSLATDCSNLPYSKVDFQVEADNGTVFPSNLITSNGDGRCNNVSVTTSSLASGAVRGGSLVGIGDKCMGPSGGSSSNGTHVVLQDCSPAADHQYWRYENGNIINGTGKCLTNEGAFFSNLTDLILWDCNSASAHQKYNIPDPTSQLLQQITTTHWGRCLTTEGAFSSPGTQIVLYDCDPVALHQKFRFD